MANWKLDLGVIMNAIVVPKATVPAYLALQYPWLSVVDPWRPKFTVEKTYLSLWPSRHQNPTCRESKIRKLLFYFRAYKVK